MNEIERREFLKLTGAGLGVIAMSSLFHDRLLAGTMPADGATLFEERFGVSRETMAKLLATALSRGGDFAELFFEYRVASSVRMEDDLLKESSEDIGLGVGIRVLKGKQTGFGYSSDLSEEKMKAAALTAAAIAASAGQVGPPEAHAGQAGPAGLPHGPSARGGTAGRQDRHGHGGLQGRARPRHPDQEGDGHLRRRTAGRDHRQQRGTAGVRHAPAGPADRHGHRRGERHPRDRQRQRRRPGRGDLLPVGGNDAQGCRQGRRGGGDHPPVRRQSRTRRPAGGVRQQELRRDGPRGGRSPVRGRRDLAEVVDHARQARPDGGQPHRDDLRRRHHSPPSRLDERRRRGHRRPGRS